MPSAPGPEIILAADLLPIPRRDPAPALAPAGRSAGVRGLRGRRPFGPRPALPGPAGPAAGRPDGAEPPAWPPVPPCRRIGPPQGSRVLQGLGLAEPRGQAQRLTRFICIRTCSYFRGWPSLADALAAAARGGAGMRVRVRGPRSRVGAVGLVVRVVRDEPVPSRPAARPRPRPILAWNQKTLAHSIYGMAATGRPLAAGASGPTCS